MMVGSRKEYRDIIYLPVMAYEKARKQIFRTCLSHLNEYNFLWIGKDLMY